MMSPFGEHLHGKQIFLHPQPAWRGLPHTFAPNIFITNFTVAFPGISLPCSGTKTSKPAEHKVMGTGSKHFVSASVVVMVNGTFATGSGIQYKGGKKACFYIPPHPYRPFCSG